MTEKITLSTKAQIRERLNDMAASDVRTVSGFISWLINQEWLKRHPEDATISVEEKSALAKRMLMIKKL